MWHIGLDNFGDLKESNKYTAHCDSFVSYECIFKKLIIAFHWIAPKTCYLLVYHKSMNMRISEL